MGQYDCKYEFIFFTAIAYYKKNGYKLADSRCPNFCLAATRTGVINKQVICCF